MGIRGPSQRRGDKPPGHTEWSRTLLLALLGTCQSHLHLAGLGQLRALPADLAPGLLNTGVWREEAAHVPGASLTTRMGTGKPAWGATQGWAPHPPHPAGCRVLQRQAAPRGVRDCTAPPEPAPGWGRNHNTQAVGQPQWRGSEERVTASPSRGGRSPGVVASACLPTPALPCAQPAANHIPWPSRSRAP